MPSVPAVGVPSAIVCKPKCWTPCSPASRRTGSPCCTSHPNGSSRSDSSAISASTKPPTCFRADVDMKADITNLPLPDNSYDVVFASHVLEHVPDDRKAVSEIHRILRPGGIAILPVPIYGPGATIEYGKPRPEECGHIRAPGLSDYFDRYKAVFGEVTVYSSDDMSAAGDDNQLYVRPRTADGEDMIADHVPVCRKTASA